MKITKRSSKPRDPRTGRFKPAFKRGKATPTLATNSTFLQHLASISDIEEVALKVRNLARKGDWSALQIQIESLRHAALVKSDHQPIDYTLYSDYEIKLLMALMRKGRGEPHDELYQLLPPPPAPDSLEPVLDAPQAAQLAANEPVDGEFEPIEPESADSPEYPDPGDKDLVSTQLIEAEAERKRQWEKLYGQQTGDDLGTRELSRPVAKWTPRRERVN